MKVTFVLIIAVIAQKVEGWVLDRLRDSVARFNPLGDSLKAEVSDAGPVRRVGKISRLRKCHRDEFVGEPVYTTEVTDDEEDYDILDLNRSPDEEVTFMDGEGDETCLNDHYVKFRQRRAKLSSLRRNPKKRKRIQRQIRDGSVVKRLIHMYTSSPSPNRYCQVCQHGLSAARRVALHAPEDLPLLLQQLCSHELMKDNKSCKEELYLYNQPFAGSHSNFATDLANSLMLMDIKGIDGQYFCHYILQGLCESPEPPKFNLSSWWPEKPKDLKPPVSSGEVFNVLHVSDIHLSLRYAPGSEANCLGTMCCLPGSKHDPFEDYVSAPKYGHYKCDPPPILVESSLQSAINIGQEQNGIDYEFALFTGDMIDHNPALISYTESVEEETTVMRYLKQHLQNSPVFPVLGNHDSYPFSQVAQESSGFADLFSFNSDLMASMWQDYGWIDAAGAQQAREHYGGYAVNTRRGLRVISLNSNFWYRWNFYNYWGLAEDPDPSGIFRFLVDELLAAERENRRVWIIGHVPPGGITDEALPIGSEIFNQIIERFSPETIAAIFFGHTHRDEFTLLYSSGRRFEERGAGDVLNMAWIAPSVTPLANYNPSWRYYKVDTRTFSIMDSVTYYTMLNETFDASDDSEPFDWSLGYSARDEYAYPLGWPKNSPLNATFWHIVSERIRDDPIFAQRYVENAHRYSPHTPECTDANCRYENYCYTASMSVADAVECRQKMGVHVRKWLTGGPTYPMPRPLREIVEST